MENLHLPFLHLVFAGFVSLFPPVNPIGTALILDPWLSHLDTQQRRRASAKITLFCFGVCVATLLIGSWLLDLFGISLPVVQTAGGILICKMGWDLLSTRNGSDPEAKQSAAPDNLYGGVEDLLFYPMAFPMTTGAGTISVLLTLSAHGHNPNLAAFAFDILALVIAVIMICVLIYLSYAYTPFLLKRLGHGGEVVLNRLSAFLVFCVGLQIAANGVTGLLAHRH